MTRRSYDIKSRGAALCEDQSRNVALFLYLIVFSLYVPCPSCAARQQEQSASQSLHRILE